MADAKSWLVRGLGLFVAVLAVVLGYVTVAYGTVAPCGILKQEIMTRAKATAERSGGQGLLREGTEALGLRAGEEALEAQLADYSEWQCTQFMWNVKTGEYEEVRQILK